MCTTNVYHGEYLRLCNRYGIRDAKGLAGNWWSQGQAFSAVLCGVHEALCRHVQQHVRKQHVAGLCAGAFRGNYYRLG